MALLRLLSGADFHCCFTDSRYKLGALTATASQLTQGVFSFLCCCVLCGGDKLYLFPMLFFPFSHANKKVPTEKIEVLFTLDTELFGTVKI